METAASRLPCLAWEAFEFLFTLRGWPASGHGVLAPAGPTALAKQWLVLPKFKACSASWNTPTMVAEGEVLPKARSGNAVTPTQ